jgi:eukaryotic-like serine/threonine-protein kinase
MVEVAVVEEDSDLATRMAKVLGGRGHEVLVFPDGATALLGMRADRFRLVIVQAQSPQLDGISLTKALRAMYDSKRLQILLVCSDHESEETLLEALEAGADDVLLSPFRDHDLLAKVSSSLVKQGLPPPRTRVFLREDATQLPCRYGHYELLHILGEGGFGAVFRARRLSDDQPLAIKLLHPKGNDDRAILARFFREMRLLERLDSPYVVSVLDSGFEAGRFYLAMEFVKGRTAQELYQAGPLEALVAAGIGHDVASALGAIHAEGIVHRDLKPANLIVGESGKTTLVDLGLAKEGRDRALTQSSELVGTLAYLAPEVIEGAPATPSSDLYGLGVTLYELLTGERAFRGNLLSLLARITSGEPLPRVDSVRPDVPARLADVIANLVDPDVGRRADDASAIASELREIGP